MNIDPNRLFNGKLILANNKEIPNYITHDEIIAITFAFLKDKGYPLSNSLRQLSIFFIPETRYGKDGIDRFLPKIFKWRTRDSTSGNYLSLALSIKLFVPHLQNRRDFIKTLLYELDHVVWFLEHCGRFDRSKRYRARPHEKRARKTSRKWYRKAKKIASRNKPQ